MIVNPPQDVNNLGFSSLENKVQNPGFESGVALPWLIPDTHITIVNPHTGIYCCSLNLPEPDYLRQFLTTPIPVSDISAFTMWYNQAAVPPNLSLLRIFYTDGTETDIVFTDTSLSWIQVDALASLTAGKIVEFIAVDAYTTSLSVDDFVITAPITRNTTLLTYPPQS